MLNVDLDYLAVRLETALEVIQDVKAEQMNQSERTIRCAYKKCFENNVVITKYNNKIYRIKKVLCDKNPQSIFTKTIIDPNTGRKKYQKQSHAQYLSEKYYKTVTNMEQPLLETENGMCLIPEFCFVTNLSETTMNLPSKFSLVREFMDTTNPDI